MGTKAKIQILIIFFLYLTRLDAQDVPDTVTQATDTSYFIAGDDNYNLLAAADRGDSIIVHMLLKRGANVNTKTWDNVTPLMYAAGRGHLGIVQILVTYGALIDEKPDNHMSALLSAAQFEYIDVLEYLILNGADINDQDEKGATALMYAAAYNYYIVADMLLFYEADTETKDKEGNTALMIACHSGNTDIVDLLLTNQAYPECTNQLGSTPLMVASTHGFDDIVQTLIEFDVNLNTMNQEGMTALSFASRNGHKAVVEKLLYYGADPNVSKEPIANPITLAKKANHFEIVNVLKEAGAKEAKSQLYINRMGMGFNMNWNTKDFMYGGAVDVQNDKLGVDLEFGYLTRAGHKRVLIERSEHSYYQLYEKRSLAYAACSKRFKLSGTGSGGTQGLFAGGKGIYTYGKYKGVTFNVDDGFLFVPEIGYYSMSRNTSMKVSYEFMNFDIDKVSPHRVNITLAFLINFKKGAVSDYKINWLD